MKLNKKKIAVVALIICLLAIVSMSSLAWFTADDYVENTLNFVTSFEMDLIEHNGTTVVGSGSNHTGLTFNNVKPGDKLDKDPTVINKSSEEEQWIKMTVKIDNAAAWAEVVPAGTDLTTIFTGYDDSLWLHPEDPQIVGTDYVATFYLKAKLGAGEQVTLFTGISIPESMTLAQAKAIGSSTITVTADAMQADVAEDVLTAFGVSAN